MTIGQTSLSCSFRYTDNRWKISPKFTSATAVASSGLGFGFEDGDSEELLLTPVEGDLYRLDESSFIGEARYGDVIRASCRDDGGLVFLRIETPSGLVAQSWVLSQSVLDSPECVLLLEHVVAIGGNWERAFGGILLVHTPRGSEGEIAERIKQIANLPSGVRPHFR